MHMQLSGAPATLEDLTAAYADAHALYDALRARDRVTWDATGRCWLVTGHEATRRILADARFISDPTVVAPPARRPARRSFLSDAVQRQVIFTDGPRQEAVRRAVLVELARRQEALAGPLLEVARVLAERGRARGELDLLGDFAIPFSMEAISRIMGLPEVDEEEMARLERWSTTFANITSGYLQVDVTEVVQLGDYFRAQVAARGGTPSDDLIGAFLRDGGLDDEEDVVIQCMMAFAAGRVTTQKALGSGIPLLLPSWGEWRRQIAENPGSGRRLAEEILRVVTPTRYVARYAAEDLRLDGEDGREGPSIRRGDRVVLFLEAANHDPSVFADPHALEAARRPNPHLAFGSGSHRCPGASIARVEVQVAVQALLETLAQLRPHPHAAPAWEPNPNLGGYASYRCLCA
ncbi:cytochrome P450 [Longimicrobium sp.]|uniref:cytochrome P450 n=1 Tax=Longimicrobium sp. TaxID=2029185 RepID=UPI002E347BDF|nr:cytochrome P450 [Longimicrobium sp.]HEX6039838.1 cytochrome P450 [Longimicrobium sp.]